MARMTIEIFREIIESAETDIETLEIESMTTEGEDAPTEIEQAAIIRVQDLLRSCIAGIKREIDANTSQR